MAYFVIIHMGVDHHTWARRVQFTYEYNQATRVCTCAHACPESVHPCDTHDMCCSEVVGDLYHTKVHVGIKCLLC